jgi:hypothetical protein
VIGEASLILELILHFIKAGQINFLVNGIESFQLVIENRKANINIIKKESLKDLSTIRPKRTSMLRSFLQLRKLAEKIERQEFTITLSHRDRIVLTISKEANPRISHLITRTKAIEINDFRELARLVKELV